jgi:hypothetical protein
VAKNAWSCTSASRYVFTACWLVRSSFILPRVCFTSRYRLELLEATFVSPCFCLCFICIRVFKDADSVSDYRAQQFFYIILITWNKLIVTNLVQSWQRLIYLHAKHINMLLLVKQFEIWCHENDNTILSANKVVPFSQSCTQRIVSSAANIHWSTIILLKAPAKKRPLRFCFVTVVSCSILQTDMVSESI